MPIDINMTELVNKFWCIELGFLDGLSAIALNENFVTWFKGNNFKKTSPLNNLSCGWWNNQYFCFAGAGTDFFLLGDFLIDDPIK